MEGMVYAVFKEYRKHNCQTAVCWMLLGFLAFCKCKHRVWVYWYEIKSVTGFSCKLMLDKYI